MKWYVFLTSSIGTPSERAINELSPRHALHLYFNAKVAGELSIVKVDSILSCDWIDAAFMFEDEKLGIVYLRDQKLIQPVIDVLKQGLPLIRINPPK